MSRREHLAFWSVILAGMYDIKNLKQKIGPDGTHKYNRRGEEQLVGYLEQFHLDKGYLLSFNFNQKKNVGVKKFVLHGKEIAEAVV